MIASFYGMNVSLPFSAQPLAFFYLIGATGFIIILAVLYFQRKRWL
jgi:Mg2+ and Co2+ transporter CorA